MSIDQDIANSARQLETDVKINHQITHGGDTVEVPTEGGPVPSIRKRLKDIETEWSKTADPLASDLASTVQVTRGYKDAAAASASAAAAETVKVTAEGVKQIKAVVDQGTLTIGQVKTEGGKQIAAASSQADRAAAQVPLAAEQASRSKNYATESKTASTVATTAKEGAVAAGNTASQHAATAANEATRSEQEADNSATSAGESRTAANRAQEVAAKFGNVDQAIREARQEADRASTAAEEAEFSETKAAQHASRADSEADRAKTEADRAAVHQTGAETAETNAEKAAADAAAIAYEGEATLTPAPGKLAIADSTGTFATGWIKPVAIPEPDFHLPLVNDLHVKAGLGMPVTFTRDTKGTCLDKFTGTIAAIEKDQPRFENNGVLIEGSGTNLLFHSEDLTNKTNSQVYHSVWIDTGNKFGDAKIFGATDDGYKGFQWWRNLEPVTADGTYTGSVYVHTTGIDTPETAYYKIRFTHGTVRIHETTGVISFFDGNVPREVHLERIAKGIYKLTVTFDLVAGQKPIFGLHCDNINGYAMNFSCWQLEPSPIPTSYIPTSGTAVTRTPDNLQLDESIVMHATHSEATIVFEMDFQNNKGWQNFISSPSCFNYGQYSGQGSIRVYESSKYPFPGLGINNDAPFIFCIRKQKDRFQTFANGVMKAEATGVEYASVARGITLLGSNKINGDRIIYGHIRNLRIWNHALTDHQIYHLGGTD